MKMNEHEAYLTLQAASGIEVGDKVKVLRKAEDGEMGWDNSWARSMDNFIGHVGTISNIDGSNGCRVNFTEPVEDRFAFPFFVLELVEKRTPPKQPMKVGTYEVEFAQGGESIEVGCQTISFEEVKAVYKEMKRLRKAGKGTLYDWSKASDWANWIATDGNGDIFGYAEKPVFVSTANSWDSKRGSRFSRLSQGDEIANPQETLEKRPEAK
jgi:hypothetical protein